MARGIPKVGEAAELVGPDDAAAEEGTVRHAGAFHQQRLRGVHL